MALIIVFGLFIPLSGVICNLLYGNIYIWENITVAGAVFLGFFGLHSIYTSAHVKDEKKRWLLLFMGVISVFIAFWSLELAYRSRRLVSQEGKL